MRHFSIKYQRSFPPEKPDEKITFSANRPLLYLNWTAVQAVLEQGTTMGNQHYVFNISGNKFRLVVVIQFTISRVYVRFVGTHAEYDKIDCSTI